MAFFKQRKPRQFNLKPRYYDEHKERLAQSIERVEAQLAKAAGENAGTVSAETRRENIREAFRSTIDNAKAEKAAKMRLGFIIGAGLIFFAILMHYAG